MAKDKDVKIYKCMNFGACAKADNDELIKIPAIETLGGTPPCPCCKQNTLEEQHTGGGINKKLVGMIAAIVVLVAVIGCVIAFTGNSSEETSPVEDTLKIDSVKIKTDTVTVIKTDTLTRVDTIKVEKVVEKVKTPMVQKTTTTTTSKSASSVSGSLTLSYGTFTGATKNGYPHGQGKLTYTTSRQINRNDMKGRTANAGDYVIGEFFNGFVVYGKHYDANGNLIGSLNFGVGSEDSYESK